MNRRTLIKTLGISAVGLATVPLWMESWTADALPMVGFQLDEDQKTDLAALVEIIIPATDTPGAKELGVDRFILTMVGDCYEEEVQDKFLAGFKRLDTSCKEKYNKSFRKLTAVEQQEVALYELDLPQEQENDFNFVAFVKGLSISGYMTSAYVMQNIVKYEFVPSRFIGSFPVEPSALKSV